VKDIVAAKNLNLRTIWCRELINIDQHSSSKSVAKQRIELAQNKSKNVEERLQNLLIKVSESKSAALEMQVGAEDYLLDGIRKEFCDAITDHFYNIPAIIKKWFAPKGLNTLPQPSTEQKVAGYSTTMESTGSIDASFSRIKESSRENDDIDGLDSLDYSR
jgi:hypothetical protein